MKVMRVRNVAEALPTGLEHLLRCGERQSSRAGDVLVAPEPVTTVHERPTERVLHSAVRDANPFFHLAEALWMLAGRDDAALLNTFVSDFGARFAEPDGRVHGAYGRRWRGALGFDQLAVVVEKLTHDPVDRQCVLQMWDVSPFRDDLGGDWRDRPCNTHAYLRVRSEPDRNVRATVAGGAREDRTVRGGPVLDLTVCCRSNDAVWGAHGANAVHFSVLQEYLAAALGVGVGRYYQISNNYHVYESELHRLFGRITPHINPHFETHGDVLIESLRSSQRYPEHVEPLPLVSRPEVFLAEVELTLAAYESGASLGSRVECENEFLSDTAWPILMAHRAWRSRSEELTDHWLHEIAASDWRAACSEWIARRRARRQEVAA